MELGRAVRKSLIINMGGVKHFDKIDAIDFGLVFDVSRIIRRELPRPNTINTLN